MLNFSLNFERMCKLIKEEKLANKNWMSIEQIIELALESHNFVQGFY